MEEISLILKNYKEINQQEFRILNEFGRFGNFWYLVNRPKSKMDSICRQKIREYIFDIDSFMFFKLISQNILITWNTSFTKNLKVNEEFHLCDSLYLNVYVEYR